MIMKKRLLFILLTLIPMMASAAAVEIDGIYYNLIKKAKLAEVIGMPSGKCTGSVVIPATVTYDDVTYDVTSIGQSAFSGCSGLTSITIPNSVTSIGGSAFYDCSGLTSITIPHSVTSIGSSAFAGCFCLTSITIPHSVTSIGSSAFSACTALTSVTIPNSVTSIGYSAFKNCFCLTSITLPESVTSIGFSLFAGCSALTSITIPESVTSIEDYAFEGCAGLTSITIPNSVTNIGERAFFGCSGLTSVTIGNSVKSIGRYVFYGCTALTSVTIPNSVTSIESDAFSGCSALTSITIPESVTSIGDYAFSRCTSLKNIVCLAKKAPSVSSYSFSNTNSAILHVPQGSKSSYTRNSYWSILSIYEDVDIWDYNAETNTLTIKCEGAMENYQDPSYTLWCEYRSSIKEIYIREGVTSIGSCAFKENPNLITVTIPSTVTTISSQAFANCNELTDIYCLAESVPAIESNAFANSYIDYATLHVPAASVNAYKTSEPWSMFGTIVGMTDEEIKTILGVDEIISRRPQSFIYYDLQGRQTTSPQKGLYIKDGKKVIIK